MKFKKDGKVYNVIDAVHEYCKNTDCLECKLYDEDRDCLACECRSPEQVACLMGYEVIEDTPTIDEAVEENSGNVKRKLTPCGHPARGGEVRMRTARDGLRHAGGQLQSDCGAVERIPRPDKRRQIRKYDRR